MKNKKMLLLLVLPLLFACGDKGGNESSKKDDSTATSPIETSTTVEEPETPEEEEPVEKTVGNEDMVKMPELTGMTYVNGGFRPLEVLGQANYNMKNMRTIQSEYAYKSYDNYLPLFVPYLDAIANYEDYVSTTKYYDESFIEVYSSSESSVMSDQLLYVSYEDGTRVVWFDNFTDTSAVLNDYEDCDYHSNQSYVTHYKTTVSYTEEDAKEYLISEIIDEFDIWGIPSSVYQPSNPSFYCGTIGDTFYMVLRQNYSTSNTVANRNIPCTSVCDWIYVIRNDEKLGYVYSDAYYYSRCFFNYDLDENPLGFEEIIPYYEYDHASFEYEDNGEFELPMIKASNRTGISNAFIPRYTKYVVQSNKFKSVGGYTFSRKNDEYVGSKTYAVFIGHFSLSSGSYHLISNGSGNLEVKPEDITANGQPLKGFTETELGYSDKPENLLKFESFYEDVELKLYVDVNTGEMMVVEFYVF